MKRFFIVLLIVTLVPLVVSCRPFSATKETVKGTGEGTTSIVEGAGTGTVELGKGAVGTVTQTTKATGEFITGQGDEAAESGQAAIDAGAGGIKAIVVEPVKGLEKGLQQIDAGIKRATGSEDVK